MFHFLLELLFPRRCLACGKAGAYFCKGCRPYLQTAAPLEEAATLACFHYDEPAIKKAVWKLKYSGITSLASEMAELMSERLTEEVADLSAFSGKDNIIITSIPLSRKRGKERGYNQAALLGKAIGKHFPHLTYYQDLLIKVKETPPQASLKQRAARLKNLDQAFSLKSDSRVEGRTIILIDDVITTGATLAEARRVLKNAGAKEVLGIAFCHRE